MVAKRILGLSVSKHNLVVRPLSSLTPLSESLHVKQLSTSIFFLKRITDANQFVSTTWPRILYSFHYQN